MGKSFSIGVFGLIFNIEDHVLLCHRRDCDMWNLPGGGLAAGEHILDGLKREIFEETGLQIEANKLVGIYDKPQENDIAFLFICNVIRGEIKLNDEADKIEYFPINNLPHNTIPNHLERIADAFQDYKKVIIKKQTRNCQFI